MGCQKTKTCASIPNRHSFIQIQWTVDKWWNIELSAIIEMLEALWSLNKYVIGPTYSFNRFKLGNWLSWICRAWNLLVAACGSSLGWLSCFLLLSTKESPLAGMFLCVVVCRCVFICVRLYLSVYVSMQICIFLWVCTHACIHVCVLYVLDTENEREQKRDWNSFDAEIMGQNLYWLSIVC